MCVSCRRQRHHALRGRAFPPEGPGRKGVNRHEQQHPAGCSGFYGDAEDQCTPSTGGKAFKGMDMVTIIQTLPAIGPQCNWGCDVTRIQTRPPRRKLRIRLSSDSRLSVPSGRMFPAQLQGAMCTADHSGLGWQ